MPGETTQSIPHNPKREKAFQKKISLSVSPEM